MSVRRGTFALSAVGLLLTACQPSTDWIQHDNHRWRNLRVPNNGQSGFTLVDPRDTRITFENNVSEDQALANEHVFNGSGVAAGDVDGDGLVDLYFARLDGPNVLYRNRGGMRFEDITDQARVSAPDRLSTGALFADVDGDRDLDLVTTSMGGPTSLFVNDGRAVFTDQTTESGLAHGFYGTTMTMADVDGDGDLDLYVANNKVTAVRDLYPPEEIAFDKVVAERNGEFEIVEEFREHYTVFRQGGRIARFEFAEPDKFYLGDGTGRFEEVSFTDGRFRDGSGMSLMQTPRDWGLTARFYDVDHDGDPDLYVANDFESPDHFWINDGIGNFQMIPMDAVRTTSNANMAVDFADIDRDGDTDIFQVDMLDRNTGKQKTQRPNAVPEEGMLGVLGERQQVPRNVLLLARGDGTYAEAGYLAGIEASGWSWGMTFLDVDLDGYEDVLVANGHAHDFLDVDTRMRTLSLSTQDWREFRFLYPPHDLPNVAFRNLGNWQFEEVAEEWGFAVGADIGHGIATADLDGDGDLDVVVNRLGRPAAIFRNEASAGRVAVRLRGAAPNTAAIGAKIRVLGGAVPVQQREVTAGGTYVSSSETLYTFATGNAESLAIEVDWRAGGTTVIDKVIPNTLYEITESGGAREDRQDSITDPSPTEPLFTDVSHMLDHVHVDREFDDFARQPMLPNRLSQLGPGVAWSDLDRDGDEDLAITGGAGGRVLVFRNMQGAFVPWSQYAMAQFDATALVTVVANGRPALAMGQANYEADSPEVARRAAPALLGISPNRAQALTGAAGLNSTGPLAAADYDGDGDLDMLIGGRVKPGQYPAPASSMLLRRQGASFVVDEANTATLADVGLVSGAVFSDIDDDGDADLLLALEFDPIKVFLNRGGVFTDATDSLGFGSHSGAWNGVTTGDLNGDGRIDVIATNWGRNTKLRPSAEHPVEVYFADFDRDGVQDVVLAQFDTRLNAVVPLQGLDRLGESMRYVRQRFATFRRFADATLTDAVGPAINEAEKRSATTFDHMVFYNRGDGFEAAPMHVEAQLAPAFHAAVADFDGDGHEDLFLSQNFFPTHDDTQRYDSGRGLLLLGNGTEHLEPMDGAQSGIRIYGDQRGAAAGDFNGDGRTDLAVGQNRGATVLLENTRAEPGLRVRLVGNSGNPFAFGATVQLVYADGTGPLREVHGGSGYWSQDGATQVLGMRGVPIAVRVKWPDGTRVEVDVEEDAKEVVVRR